MTEERVRTKEAVALDLQRRASRLAKFEARTTLNALRHQVRRPLTAEEVTAVFNTAKIRCMQQANNPRGIRIKEG